VTVPPAGNGPVSLSNDIWESRSAGPLSLLPSEIRSICHRGKRNRHGRFRRRSACPRAKCDRLLPSRQRDGNAEGLPGHRGEGNPAQGRLPRHARTRCGRTRLLQRPRPTACACPGETKGHGRAGRVEPPPPRRQRRETPAFRKRDGPPFRIVPRAVRGDGELRFPLPDDAPNVRNPRSGRRRSIPRYPVPRRLYGDNPLPRVERTGEAKCGGVPYRLELPDAKKLPPCRKDPHRPTETATLRLRPRQRHVALRPFKGRGDMRPRKRVHRESGLRDDGLEPAERTGGGKEDRSVHEEDLRQGEDGPSFRVAIRWS